MEARGVRAVCGAAVLALLAISALTFGAGALDAADCNGNGVEDALDIQGKIDFAAGAPVPTDSGVRALAAADMDGDGDIDLTAGVTEKTAVAAGLQLLKNDGAGAFAAVGRLDLEGIPGNVAAADLDSDGDRDLAVALNFRDPLVFLNVGDGSFEAPFGLSSLWAQGTVMARLLAADLDGDEDLEIAVLTARGLQTFLNDGDARFDFTTFANTGSNGTPVSLAAADLDGDGDLDLAAGQGGTPAILLLNRGDAVFAPAPPA
ncbi:MAG: VCBS repeat-containing protein, partial [Planctomycetes bacterium]|nr:VCBS repeat-containing protein [Planctomycetota bacterium]